MTLPSVNYLAYLCKQRHSSENREQTSLRWCWSKLREYEKCLLKTYFLDKKVSQLLIFWSYTSRLFKGKTNKTQHYISLNKEIFILLFSSVHIFQWNTPSLSVYLSFCLSASLSISLSVCLSLFACLSVCLFVFYLCCKSFVFLFLEKVVCLSL